MKNKSPKYNRKINRFRKINKNKLFSKQKTTKKNN